MLGPPEHAGLCECVLGNTLPAQHHVDVLVSPLDSGAKVGRLVFMYIYGIHLSIDNEHSKDNLARQKLTTHTLTHTHHIYHTAFASHSPSYIICPFVTSHIRTALLHLFSRALCILGSPSMRGCPAVYTVKNADYMRMWLLVVGKVCMFNVEWGCCGVSACVRSVRGKSRRSCVDACGML